MALTLTSTATAVAAGGLPISFLASGGTAPYTYSLAPNGPGGSIDPSTGTYQSPAIRPLDPAKAYDVVRVVDSSGAFVTSRVLVATPIGLVCDIIQKEMGLADGRVYFYNQKIFQPTDSGIYIAVGLLMSKPFGNSIKYQSGGGLDALQSINVLDTLSINVISRSDEALFRKEEVLLALASNYSESQQELNSFSIGKLPPSGQFVNISDLDGSAIPYRFNISINVQYFVRRLQGVPYFDDFATPTVDQES